MKQAQHSDYSQFISVYEYENFKGAMAKWLGIYRPEYFLTLSIENGMDSIDPIQRGLIHWAGRLKKACHTDVAFVGALVGGHSAPHIHGLLWGRDHKGVALKDNPRFPQGQITPTGYVSSRHGWPGSVDVRAIHNKAGVIDYITSKNASTVLFQAVGCFTNKKLLTL